MRVVGNRGFVLCWIEKTDAVEGPKLIVRGGVRRVSEIAIELAGLEAQDVVGGRADTGVVLAAEEGHEQNPLGLEDGVALELADPVAIGPLAREQAATCSLNRGWQRRWVG